MAQNQDVAALQAFLDGRAARPTVGLVYGRRRIGKSTLLVGEVERRGGFYSRRRGSRLRCISSGSERP